MVVSNVLTGSRSCLPFPGFGPQALGMWHLVSRPERALDSPYQEKQRLLRHAQQARTLDPRVA